MSTRYGHLPLPSFGNAGLEGFIERAGGSFDEDGARIYAEVRQDKTIKAPDAVQLSCCGRAGCDMFVTNDERLCRKRACPVMPGIHFIASLDRALLFTGAKSR